MGKIVTEKTQEILATRKIEGARADVRIGKHKLNKWRRHKETLCRISTRSASVASGEESDSDQTVRRCGSDIRSDISVVIAIGNWAKRRWKRYRAKVNDALRELYIERNEDPTTGEFFQSNLKGTFLEILVSEGSDFKMRLEDDRASKKAFWSDLKIQSLDIEVCPDREANSGVDSRNAFLDFAIGDVIYRVSVTVPHASQQSSLSHSIMKDDTNAVVHMRGSPPSGMEQTYGGIQDAMCTVLESDRLTASLVKSKLSRFGGIVGVFGDGKPVSCVYF